MSKKQLYALLLMGVTVLILLINNDKVQVQLFFTSFKAMAALVFLGFTAVGIVIGTLLR